MAPIASASTSKQKVKIFTEFPHYTSNLQGALSVLSTPVPSRLIRRHHPLPQLRVVVLKTFQTPAV